MGVEVFVQKQLEHYGRSHHLEEAAVLQTSLWGVGDEFHRRERWKSSWAKFADFIDGSAMALTLGGTLLLTQGKAWVQNIGQTFSKLNTQVQNHIDRFYESAKFVL